MGTKCLAKRFLWIHTILTSCVGPTHTSTCSMYLGNPDACITVVMDYDASPYYPEASLKHAGTVALLCNTRGPFYNPFFVGRHRHTTVSCRYERNPNQPVLPFSQASAQVMERCVTEQLAQSASSKDAVSRRMSWPLVWSNDRRSNALLM